MGSDDLANSTFQLGAARLVDQLAGQYMAHICGLGYIRDQEHVRTTLRSIMRYNHRSEFHTHFNHMRTYALADEAYFWSNGWAWGTCRQEPEHGHVKVTISVLIGELPLRSVELTGLGRQNIEAGNILRRGESATVTIAASV